MWEEGSSILYFRRCDARMFTNAAVDMAKFRNFYGNREGNNQTSNGDTGDSVWAHLACAALLYWVGLDALAED